jgi:hypothetical protein
MTITINGTTGVTYPAGGTDNVAGSGVGTTDTQTLTNKTLTNPTITGGTVEATSGPTSTQLAGNRNKIINGAMMIDQRNAGASSVPSTNTYLLDRWRIYQSVQSKLTIGQNLGSITPPAGFSNYLGVSVSTPYTITATDYYFLNQNIEAFNTADLSWGASSAKSVTLSFWVYSSLIGTFGGSLENAASTRVYPFSYSIPVANTWTQIAISIAGDTTGTWLGATNGTGIQLALSLGTGSTYSGTAGSWSSNDYRSVTSAVSILGTNGATFYITGVQLEKGATATPFENRLYGAELALCQRYYETNFSGTKVPTNTYNNYTNLSVGSQTYAGGSGGSQQVLGPVPFVVSKRAAPTVYVYSYSSSSLATVSNGWSGADFSANSGVVNVTTVNGFSLYNNTGSNITTSGYNVILNYAASSEL